MLGPTHRALAVTAATGVSVACSAPMLGAAVIITTAWHTACLPDRLEKLGGRHRTWTHWLLTTILTALLVSGVVFGALYGLSELARDRMPGEAGARFADTIYVNAVGWGVLIALGALCGTVMHTLADACTISGTPLLGPFTRRDLHLMPPGLRTCTGQTVTHPDGTKERTWDMTGGERNWLLGAWATTVLLLALHWAPHLHDVFGDLPAPPGT